MNDFAPVAIAPTDTKHILSVLTAQYSDPITSVLRELVTNALDAQRVAGTKTPVHVTLPSSDDPTLTVEDHGTGMDRESFERVQCAYGASTKRDDDDLIGKYGIGSKSVMMVADTYSITNTHEGHQWRADFELTESGPQYRITDLGPTDEHNGFCVKAQINQSEDGNPMQTCALWSNRAINFFWWIDPSLYRLTHEGNDITLSENYFTQRSNTNYLATDAVKTFTGDNRPTKLTSNVVVMDHYAYQLHDVPMKKPFPRNTNVEMPTKSLHLTPNRERLVNDAHNSRVLEAVYDTWSQDIDARRKTDIDNTTCIAQAVYFYGQNYEIIHKLDRFRPYNKLSTYNLIIQKYADDIQLIKKLLGRKSLTSLHGCGYTTSQPAGLKKITNTFEYQTWIITVDQKDDQRPNKAALGDLRYWLKRQSETMDTHRHAIIWDRTMTQDQTTAMNIFMDEAFLNSYPYTMSLDDVRTEVKSMKKNTSSRVRRFSTQRLLHGKIQDMTGAEIAEHLSRTGGRLIVDGRDNLKYLRLSAANAMAHTPRTTDNPTRRMNDVLAFHRMKLMQEVAERDLLVYKSTAPGSTLVKETNVPEASLMTVNQVVNENREKAQEAAHNEMRDIVVDLMSTMQSKDNIDEQTISDYVSLMESQNYELTAWNNGSLRSIHLFAQHLLKKDVIPKLRKYGTISATVLRDRLQNVIDVNSERNSYNKNNPTDKMLAVKDYLNMYGNDLFTTGPALGDILTVTIELWRNISKPSATLTRATLTEDMR